MIMSNIVAHSVRKTSPEVEAAVSFAIDRVFDEPRTGPTRKIVSASRGDMSSVGWPAGTICGSMPNIAVQTAASAGDASHVGSPTAGTCTDRCTVCRLMMTPPVATGVEIETPLRIRPGQADVQQSGGDPADPQRSRSGPLPDIAVMPFLLIGRHCECRRGFRSGRPSFEPTELHLRKCKRCSCSASEFAAGACNPQVWLDSSPRLNPSAASSTWKRTERFVRRLLRSCAWYKLQSKRKKGPCWIGYRRVGLQPFKSYGLKKSYA